jgi:hypothetical protein
VNEKKIGCHTLWQLEKNSIAIGYNNQDFLIAIRFMMTKTGLVLITHKPTLGNPKMLLTSDDFIFT